MIQYYKHIELVAMNVAILGLFVLMVLAVRDVLNKSDVPKYGKVVVYSVLFLGTMSFIAKGIFQIIWELVGVSS